MSIKEVKRGKEIIMKYNKRLLIIVLSLLLLLSASLPTLASTPAIKNETKIELYGEEYKIYSKDLKDGSIEKKVVNPDKTIEYYIIKENVMYSANGEKIATFSEQPVYFPNDITIQATSYSDTSPYPVSDYSIYKGMKKGNVVLDNAITNITVGALAIIVGVVAPPIGTALSVMLLADARAKKIETYAIFYEKYEYHHKNLLSLEKMYETQWYWDPYYSVKAGTLQRFYSSFY